MKNLNRWVYAAIGVLVLLFAGMVYAWSVLSSPIAVEYAEWTKAQLSLTFTIVMIFFCIGCTAGGFFINKFNAKIYVWVSAVLFLAGYMISANISSITMLYIGFGVICGFASGLAYNAVMATVGKWFPDKQGLISGILLMGFGLSSFIIGKVFQACTPETIGAWRVTYKVIGIVTAIVLALCGFFMEKPGPDYQVKASAKEKNSAINPVARELTTPQMLKTPQFWLYFVWAILLSAAGLAITSQAAGMAREVGPGVDAGTIATVVGLISIANGVSRVIMGAAYDKVGRSAVMLIVSVLFIVAGAVFIFSFSLQSFALVTFAFIIGGVAYGGVTPTNSAFISSYFGMKNYPLNFSMVNMNLLVASFGSTVAGALYDSSQSYVSTYIMLIVLAVLGIIVSVAISSCDNKLQREMEQAKN